MSEREREREGGSVVFSSLDEQTLTPSRAGVEKFSALVGFTFEK